MGWSKRQLITEAYTELGMADYVYDLTPAELQTALRRMDAMMASWEVDGIRCAYPRAGTPSASDIDAVTSVPDAAVSAIVTNLAMQLAPGYGKSVAAETMVTAKKSKATLRNFLSRIPEMQFPSSLPRGAGQKPWRGYGDPFMPRPTSPVLAGQDGEIEFD